MGHFTTSLAAGLTTLASLTAVNSVAQRVTFDTAFDEPRKHGYMVHKTTAKQVTAHHQVLYLKCDARTGNTFVSVTALDDGDGHVTRAEIADVTYARDKPNGDSEVVELKGDSTIHRTFCTFFDSTTQTVARVTTSAIASVSPDDRRNAVLFLEQNLTGGTPFFPRQNTLAR